MITRNHRWLAAACLFLLAPIAPRPPGQAAPGTVPRATVPEQPAWLAEAQQSIASREYQATDTGLGLQAPNRAHGLRTFFDTGGARVVDREDGSDLARLRTLAVGRGDALVPVAPGDVHADGTRVEVRRPGLVEWFVNSDAGLEQGWTVGARPDGDGSLTVEIAVDATTLDVEDDRVVLDAAGRRLDYGSLVAWDATGASLLARFERAPRGLRVLVEDAGATYPVTIDPTLTSPPFAQLEANQVSAFFGCAVSGAGDVNGDGYDDCIVGAQSYDSGQANEGAAFIFLGGPTGIQSGSPTTAATTLQSNQANAVFGYSVAGVGDTNGDGYDDVVVGAIGYDSGQTDEGAAFVFLGSASGVQSGNPSTAAATLQSNQASANFGGAVSGAGDVNGDGFADVIVGASAYDSGQSNEGAAFIFLGGLSGVPSGNPATAATTLQSNQADAAFGESVAGAGDTNADGFDDVIVGASTYDSGQSNEGIAVVFLGGDFGVPNGSPASGSILQPNQVNAHFGISVSGAGDVDGDGFDDVIVGASDYDANTLTDQGGAFIFRGSASGVPPGSPISSETILLSDQAGALFGSSVSGAGDVDGDGYADVVVGAPNFDRTETDEGTAFVFLGRAGGIPSGGPEIAASTVQSDQDAAFFGARVSAAGDTDGDGYDDVVAGARSYDAGQSTEGAAFVYRGGPYGLASYPRSAATLESNQSGAQFGGSVSGAGDVNGDGYDDVIVGAPYYDAGETDEGAAFVFLGGPNGVQSSSATSAATILQSDQNAGLLGIAVAGAGDTNGDGYDDVIVGTNYYDSGQLDEGAAFVFLGGPNGIQNASVSTAAATIQSNQAGSLFGHAVSGAGDVNGDGYADIIVGAHLYDAEQSAEGAAFVFLGGPSGIQSGSPATAAATLQSDQVGAALGISVAGAGDTNGDGYDDVLVGSYFFDSGQENEGAAFVFLGGPAGVQSGSASTAAAVLQSDQANAAFGYSVAGVGDTNGDGYDDVVGGAIGYDAGETEEGAAFLFLGSPAGVSNGTPATAAAVFQSDRISAYLGESVSGAGDTNGDGYDDIVIGSGVYEPGSVGAAFVFLGGPTGMADGTPRSAAVTLGSPRESGLFGRAVSGAGDTNGDGFDDVIVGASAFSGGQSSEGGAFVYLLQRPSAAGSDTVGIYVAASGAWFLRNQNAPGAADLVFTFGAGGGGIVPLVGDWDGDGDSTPGLYAPATGAFFLRNSNSPGGADLVFTFGAAGAGFLPLVGDWDGNGTDTVGLYVPSTSVFFLRNQNAPGAADLTVGFGPAGAGWRPIVGDWNGDGSDTVGLFAPSTSTFFLRNANAAGPADLTFGFGAAGSGWTPMAGDFDGDGDDSIGLYNPSSGTFFLRNQNAPGAADLVFGYGPAGVTPLVGDWDGT